MAWQRVLVALLTLHYTIPSAIGSLHDLTFSENFRNNNDYDNDIDAENFATQEQEIENQKLDQLENLLAELITTPWPKGISPILYVENNPAEQDVQSNSESSNQILETYPELTEKQIKRSRYYRKYPWKRQNSRYDAENRYLCQPSKEDVFRLLVALHEARQGNRGHVVNFCNRKRPATAIFTNIRFLGKRK